MYAISPSLYGYDTMAFLPIWIDKLTANICYISNVYVYDNYKNVAVQ